jgi:hypothetical protein
VSERGQAGLVGDRLARRALTLGRRAGCGLRACWSHSRESIPFAADDHLLCKALLCPDTAEIAGLPEGWEMSVRG